LLLIGYLQIEYNRQAAKPKKKALDYDKLTWHDLTENQYLGSSKLQKHVTSMSPQYGYMILVRGYLVLTGVN